MIAPDGGWKNFDGFFVIRSSFPTIPPTDTVSVGDFRHVRDCRACKISRCWEGPLNSDPGCARCGPNPRATWFEKTPTTYKRPVATTAEDA